MDDAECFPPSVGLLCVSLTICSGPGCSERESNNDHFVPMERWHRLAPTSQNRQSACVRACVCVCVCVFLDTSFINFVNLIIIDVCKIAFFLYVS